MHVEVSVDRCHGNIRELRARELFATARTGSTASADGAADFSSCLLYTSDAADERSSVDLGGRRIIKNKKKKKKTQIAVIYGKNN